MTDILNPSAGYSDRHCRSEPSASSAHLVPPPGDYAIIELFGHTTLVGRISEVERFGIKMLAVEPIFRDTLLPSVLHGGAAIYRLTPCSPETAWERQPRQEYQLPPAIRCTLSPLLLEASPPGDRVPRQNDGMEF